MDVPGSRFSPQIPVMTAGILSDTHIPDRVNSLHPGIMPLFRSAGVSHILHGGDICVQSVLEELSQLAPITAVRGNRDWALSQLPMCSDVTLAGVAIALMHGHGGLKGYLLSKLEFIIHGNSLSRNLKLLNNLTSGAKIVVFGHTHHPDILWYRGKLLFNPGSASFGYNLFNYPSVGLLHIYDGARFKVELAHLNGFQVHNHYWERHTD